MIYKSSSNKEKETVSHDLFFLSIYRVSSGGMFFVGISIIADFLSGSPPTLAARPVSVIVTTIFITSPLLPGST